MTFACPSLSMAKLDKIMYILPQASSTSNVPSTVVFFVSSVSCLLARCFLGEALNVHRHQPAQALTRRGDLTRSLAPSLLCLCASLRTATSCAVVRTSCAYFMLNQHEQVVSLIHLATDSRPVLCVIRDIQRRQEANGGFG